MVRDVGEAAIALGLVAAEIGQPIIVDAQHRTGRFVVVEAIGGAENAVENFRLDAVAILVLETEIRVGQTPDFLLFVIVKPGRSHAVGTVDLARLIFAAGRAHPGVEPERGAVLGDPFPAARPLGDIGHAVLDRGRRVGGEQIGRQPDQIDVAISRNDVVFHRAALFPLTVGGSVARPEGGCLAIACRV